MKIALFGKAFNPEHLEYFQILTAALEERGCKLLIWKSFHEFLKGKVIFHAKAGTFSDIKGLHGHAEMLISIGGDGTMLDSVRLVRDSGIPIVGINLGRMGFLSSIPRSAIIPAIDDIFNKRFQLVKRTLLCLHSPSDLFSDFGYAINEISINKRDTSSMVVVHTWVDGHFLNSYWADGLLIATPTGSTAYSLSCNGPILTPDSSNFVITPIAPHNLSVRPVVIPDYSLIRIRVESRDNQALISLDSQTATLNANTELLIGRADFQINLVQRTDETFFSTIRAKLHWGSDIRN